MNQKSRIWMLLLVLVAAVATATPSLAATWTVEKDGIGDFTIIQDAIDAAAPGDSILIGPGRFDTFRPGNSVVDGFAFAAVGWITTPNLTIIGAGADQTTIGPASPTESSDGRTTVSLYSDGGSVGSTIEAIHFENTAIIVVLRDGVTLQQSRVTRVPIISAAAIGVAGASGVTIRTTEVTGPDGLLTAFGTSGLVVEDCSFDDETMTGFGVGIGNGATDCMVRRCTFRRGAGGVQFGLGATGWVEDCTFEDIDVFNIDVSQGLAIVRRCFLGATRQTVASAMGRLEVYDSVIEGGTQATIATWSDVVVRGSHILNAGGLSVRSRAVAGEIVDVRHNWWGTKDTTQIEGWIDDPYGTVLWSPIADAPLPAEESSVSELKSRFRTD